MRTLHDEYKNGRLIITRRSLNVPVVLGGVGVLASGYLLSFNTASLTDIQVVSLFFGLLVSGIVTTLSGPIIKVEEISMPWDIRPDCAAAYEAIKPIAHHLFQARKCQVLVAVPDPVRKVWIDQYGAEAIEILRLIDGKVDLTKESRI